MMTKINKRIVCLDGFCMSVQANFNAHCSPRIDGAKNYTTVEIGFPTRVEPLLLPWVQDPSCPTDTVYEYVPVHVVATVCAKHGGVLSGEMPPGVPMLLAKQEETA